MERYISPTSLRAASLVLIIVDSGFGLIEESFASLNLSSQISSKRKYETNKSICYWKKLIKKTNFLNLSFEIDFKLWYMCRSSIFHHLQADLSIEISVVSFFVFPRIDTSKEYVHRSIITHLSRSLLRFPLDGYKKYMCTGALSLISVVPF